MNRMIESRRNMANSLGKRVIVQFEIELIKRDIIISNLNIQE